MSILSLISISINLVSPSDVSPSNVTSYFHNLAGITLNQCIHLVDRQYLHNDKVTPTSISAILLWALIFSINVLKDSNLFFRVSVMKSSVPKGKPPNIRPSSFSLISSWNSLAHALRFSLTSWFILLWWNTSVFDLLNFKPASVKAVVINSMRFWISVSDPLISISSCSSLRNAVKVSGSLMYFIIPLSTRIDIKTASKKREDVHLPWWVPVCIMISSSNSKNFTILSALYNLFQ